MFNTSSLIKGCTFLMMAALSSGSKPQEGPRVGHRVCTTGPDNIVFKNLDPGNYRGNSTRVPVLVSSLEVRGKGETEISFQRAVVDVNTCGLFSEIGPVEENDSVDQRLVYEDALALLGLNNKVYGVVDVVDDPSSENRFVLIEDRTEKHIQKYLLINVDSNGKKKVACELPNNLGSTRMVVDNDGKLVLLSRRSGRLVLEKRDPSTLDSLEPVKELGECSPETKIDIVSNRVFLVSDVEYGISKDVIVVRTNGDIVFIPLNGCDLGGVNVCVKNDCSEMFLQLVPGSDPKTHSCQARLQGAMLPCSGSGLFSLDPRAVIPPMAGHNGTGMFGPKY